MTLDVQIGQPISQTPVNNGATTVKPGAAIIP